MYSQTKPVEKSDTIKELAQKIFDTSSLLTISSTIGPIFSPIPNFTLSGWTTRKISPEHTSFRPNQHISGKQQILHNAIIRSPNSDRTYVYHVSNDTNHDAILTFAILEDIILKLLYKVFWCYNLIIVQYSTNVKPFLQNGLLAKKYGNRIVWFYGTAGHGKGLINAVSSFGCKSALQHAILATDTWFVSSAEILTFLKEHFKNDKNKEYHN